MSAAQQEVQQEQQDIPAQRVWPDRSARWRGLDPLDAPALASAYADLAVSIGTAYWRAAPHATDREELVSVASLALVEASRRWPTYCREREYDPARLEYLEPFVTRRMKGAVVDALRSADRATRVQRTRLRALQGAGMDAGASEADLVQATGLTPAEIRDARSVAAARDLALDTAPGDGTPGEGILARVEAAHPSPSVESRAFVRGVLGRLAAAYADLDPIAQVVLALHYYGGCELREVAGLVGLTESRASQVHTEGVLVLYAELVRAAREEVGSSGFEISEEVQRDERGEGEAA